MITSLFVDGFKSLQNFRFEIKPGINLLVGPNGAGKSNIIQFLQFLKVLLEDGIEKAFNQFGEGLVFSKLETGFADEISCTVNGKIHYSNSQWIFYRYHFCLKNKEQNIYFSQQKLEISQSELNKNPVYKTVFDLQNGIRRTGKRTSNSKIHIPLEYKYEYARKIPVLDIITIDRPVSVLIKFDLTQNHFLEISPQKMREKDGISYKPMIHQDGTGLLSTIYAIQNGLQKPLIARHIPYSEPYQPSVWETIFFYLKEVNSKIEYFQVESSLSVIN